MAKAANIQEQFLNDIVKDKLPVTVFLINGVKLQGIVVQFDESTLLLKRDGHSQLVFKNAVSTVMPSSPIELE